MKSTISLKKHSFFCFRCKLFLILFLLSGCASVSSTVFPSDGRIEYDLSQGMRIYDDANIYLSPMQINIRPNMNLNTPPTALFMPFGVVQKATDHTAISQGVSRLIWQQFLAEETFSILEFSDSYAPYRLEYALDIAKTKKAQMLVGGSITYFLDGGTTADSKIAIQIEIYDVNSGTLLWSINQSGVLPYKTDRNFAFFQVKNRMPVDPMSYLISAMGNRVATYLHNWTDHLLMEQKRLQEEEGVFDSLNPSAF